MLLRLDSCVRRNDEDLSAAMEPKFWDFAENNAVFCIMRHPRTQESRKNVHTNNLLTGRLLYIYAFPRRSVGTRHSSDIAQAVCRHAIETENTVIPAHEGVAEHFVISAFPSSFLRKQESRCCFDWIPACAGMTRTYQQRWNLNSGTSQKMTPCFALCDTLARRNPEKMSIQTIF